MSNPILDPVIEALKNRIDVKDFDFNEAARAVIDALRLREQWSYRTQTGEMGWQEYESKEQALSEISVITPEPVVIYRLVSDWKPE